jgi:hypothetical protein
MKPEIVFSKAYRKTVDPYPLHTAVKKGDLKTVERYVQYLEANGKEVLLRELYLEKPHDEWPIYFAISSYPKYYKIAILLLKAGTRPDLQADDGFALYHGAISGCYLSLLKLLIFFQPKYKSIAYKGITAEQWLISWDIKEPELGIKKTIDEAEADSFAIHANIAKAEQAIKTRQFELAADLYAENGGLYLEHAEAEMVPANHLGELDMQEFYYEEAYAAYQKAYELYGQIECLNEDAKQAAKEVLIEIIQLAKLLSKPDDMNLYTTCVGLLRAKPAYTINPLCEPG